MPIIVTSFLNIGDLCPCHSLFSIGSLNYVLKVIYHQPVLCVSELTEVTHVYSVMKISCMALHNFIRDSKLSDEEFDKCDEDEDYMPEAAHATAQPQGDDDLEEENEVTMNTIRDRIANALLVARAT